MSDEEILSRLTAIAQEILGHEGMLSPELPLVDALRLDSVRRLTLVVEIENRFELVLEPEDEAQIQTVGDLVAMIARKSAA